MRLREITLKSVTLLIIALLLMITAVTGLSFIEVVMEVSLLLYFYQTAFILTLSVCFIGAALSLFSLVRGRRILLGFIYYLALLFIAMIIMHFI